MEIRLKNEELREFSLSLSSLNGLKLSADIAITIAKVQKKIKEFEDSVEESRKLLLLGFCKKDDSGNLLPDENGKAQFLDENAQREFAIEYSKLMGKEVVLSVNPIKEEDIKKMGVLTPEQVLALLKICDETAK
jgi:hypothetical protein